MVRIVYLIALIQVLFLSCENGNSNDHDQQIKKTNVEPLDTKSADSVNSNSEIAESNLYIEHFILGDKVFKLYKGKVPDYILFEESEGVYTRSIETEQINLFDFVERLEDTLFFYFNDENLMRFSDNFYNDERMNIEDVVNFYFQGELKNLDYWKIFFLAHEYNGTILLNKNTGEKVYTLNEYVYAPDTSFVLFYNDDIHAAFTENGFHLLNQSDGKLVDAGIYEFEMWGPKAIVFDAKTNLYYVQRIYKDGYYEELDTVVMSISPYVAETES